MPLLYYGLAVCGGLLCGVIRRRGLAAAMRPAPVGLTHRPPRPSGLHSCGSRFVGPSAFSGVGGRRCLSKDIPQTQDAGAKPTPASGRG